MKSSSGWKNNGNGTNTLGFEGLPGGYRNNNEDFNYIGAYGNWWSSSEDDTYYAWFRNLYNFNGNVNRNNSDKQNGFSVRCIKD